MTRPLHVLACGLCSPLGIERGSTILELASGSDVFEETGELDERGLPIRASRLELLPPRMSRTVRMAELADQAIGELLSVARALGLDRLPIMLALPENDGGGDWHLGPLWAQLEQRAARTGIRLELLRVPGALPEGVRLSGAAGLFQLMSVADQLLDAGRDPLVLGAIDSRCDPASLTQLAAAERLIDGGVEGYLPGEGAGFLLLTRTGASRDGFEIIAHTHDHEPLGFAQGRPSEASGLTRAFRRLRLGPPQLGRVDRVLSCQWDAGYWGREFVSAYLRNAGLLPEPLRVDLVAETLGNPGAAAPILQLAHAFAIGGAEARAGQRRARVLVYGCAESGELGACVVEAKPDSRLLTQPLAAKFSPRTREFDTGRLRDHLEQIGSLMVSRHDDLRESNYPWPEVAELDRRIYDRLWIGAERGRRLGGAADEMLTHPDPDVARGYAYLLCAAGSATHRATAVARMRDLADDPEELSLWASALTHALHGRDASTLADALEGAPVPLAVALLDMLDELDHRPPALARALLETPDLDPELRWRALGLLTHAGAEAALATIEGAWREAPDDPRLIELMLDLGRLDVLDELRLACVQGRELGAAHYEVWALAPAARDAGVFAELAERTTLEPGHLWALSSHGSPTAVPALIRALDQPGLALDAGIALERILGPGWIESTWVPDPDAADPEREGQPRLRPVLDAQRWRDLWAARGSQLALGGRYRFGRPVDNHARVDEIARPTSLWSMRERALRELDATTGVPLYISFSWPVSVQHNAIVKLRAWLEGA
ncbi:hypothetical protein G6O69_29345 [Pseudenhygromyxa sp. WMMC2535]|uniref:hypothetical protein n=1 Tax=Pseudenhygromyxa sp. WMMC2535 TaxID=2712867 RepID=UPI001553662E|nr:hypothetical protein [Pseudenhygromyxa sp. WMMC2535]NVB41969.1 hypothetical protein [Pseudenhygromyxa sp. WMMC2535]